MWSEGPGGLLGAEGQGLGGVGAHGLVPGAPGGEEWGGRRRGRHDFAHPPRRRRRGTRGRAAARPPRPRPPAATAGWCRTRRACRRRSGARVADPRGEDAVRVEHERGGGGAAARGGSTTPPGTGGPGGNGVGTSISGSNVNSHTLLFIHIKKISEGPYKEYPALIKYRPDLLKLETP